MAYLYITDKDIQKVIDYNDDDIWLEEINNDYSLYDNIFKIYSNIRLEFDKDDLYSHLQIISSDKKFNKLQNKYLEKITKFKNISCVVEIKGDNYYISFFTENLPLYVKNEKKKEILEKLNIFRSENFYGHGFSDEYKLRSEGVDFETIEGIHYGVDKLSSETKKLIKDKKHYSEKNLDKYLTLKKEDNYFHYQDLEDVKNIVRVENNNLPRHKLLKTDKFLLLTLLENNNMINDIKDYNHLLANNEIIYHDKTSQDNISQTFYKLADKHYKKIFNNLEQALCFFLSYRLNDKLAILVSEKEQWIVYYRGEEKVLNNIDCRKEILKRITNKGIDIEEIKDLPLDKLANSFIHNNQLIISDKENKIFLDKDGKPLPFYIIRNHGLHHHNYYDNGIINGLIEQEKLSIILPELVEFNFVQLDNKNHNELMVTDGKKKKVLSNNFYCPAKYFNNMNNNLKILFSLGLMMHNFDIIKHQKEKEFDINSVKLPDWIKDAKTKEEKELCNFLLKFN